MLRKILSTCLLLSALPAGADCLTADSIATGVVFSRSDGRTGMAIRTKDGIAIDYATDGGPWTDTRVARLGIYETAITRYFQDDPDAVGGGDTESSLSFAGKLPEPAPGTEWSGEVHSTVWQNNSSEAGGYGYKVGYDAHYAFLAEKTVTLSGCRYRAIPVEARFLADDVDSFWRRWLYFPDLGFGLETRANGKDNGLKVLKEP